MIRPHRLADPRRLSLMLVAFAIPHAAPAAALRTGDYLEDRFMAILRQTGSPLAAFDARVLTGEAQVVRVAAVADGLRIGVLWNWHEGTALYVRRADGTIDRPADLTQGDSRATYGLAEADADGHLILHRAATPHDPAEPALGYTWVGDADRMIARAALAGRYESQDERSVVFGDDNVVHGLGLPGLAGDAPYSTDDDHVFDPYDDVLVGPSPGRRLAFRRMGDTVTLYPVLPPPNGGAAAAGVPDTDHPLLVLRERP